jgi:nitrite reductase (NADH) large subunit
MNINKGQIVIACQQSCRTVEDISNNTGAGTVCGTCKPQLARFVGMEDSFQEQVKGNKLLGFSTIISAAILLAFILLPSLAFSHSVQDPLYQSIEVLWRDSLYKQITGYSLLALTLFSMSLSLRKRIKSFNWGDFQYWRSAHILFIASVFIVLPLHSGMRMGDNINLALMLSYLFSAITGTFTSWVVWKESSETSKFNQFARRHRNKFIWFHLVCLWPLPTLLVFHVFKFYYY